MFILVVDLRRDCCNQEAAQVTVPTIVVALGIAFDSWVQTHSRIMNSATIEAHLTEAPLPGCTAATRPFQMPIMHVMPCVATSIIGNLL